MPAAPASTLSACARSLGRSVTGRHARGVGWIRRGGWLGVVFLLFAPKGRAEGPVGPAPLKLRTNSLPVLSVAGAMVGSGLCKMVKLPLVMVVRPGPGCVRSLRTQQRALVKCQIYFLADLFWVGGGLLDQFMDVSLIFVFGHG